MIFRDSWRSQSDAAGGSTDATTALDNEILFHNQHNKDQGVLTSLLSHVWDGGSGKSMADLKALEAQAQAAQTSGDAQALANVNQAVTRSIQADKKALDSCDTGLGYATGAMKTFGLFMGNKYGLAATLGVYGLDNAKSGDSFGGQVADGLLGAGKGLALRKTFEYVGAKGLGPVEQGVSIGFLSRFSDLTLTRSTYNNGFLNGIGDSAKKAADWHALAMDAGTFMVARGLFGGLNRISGGSIAANRMLSTMATGTAFGVTTGATSEIVREQNNGQGFDLGKVLKSGLIQGGIDSLAAAPGGAVAAREAVAPTTSRRNADSGARPEGLKETTMPGDAARSPGREFVVTAGQEALNGFMSGERDSQGAMLKVRELMARQQTKLGPEQQLFVQHLDQGQLLRTAAVADLVAHCVPDGSQPGANHVLPDAKGSLRLSADAEGNRIAITAGDTTAPGYERSVELGEQVGGKLQRELLNWVHMPNGPDFPGIDPDMQYARLLREEMQNKLKDGNWALFETGNRSAADRAKMDYLMINRADGRWKFFDTTLDPGSKAKVADLRRPGIVLIAREEGSPDLATRLEFMQQVIDATHEPTLFNMKDIKPPSWDASKNDADIVADVARFRKEIREEVGRLYSRADLPETDPMQAAALQEDARQLKEYDEELARSQIYSTNEVARQADPNLARYVKATRNAITSAARNVIGNMIAQKTTSAMSSYSTAPARTQVEYDPQYDRLFVYANGGQKYCIDDLTPLVEDAVTEGVNKKAMTDFDLKRRLLAGQTVESVRRAIINRLEHMWTGDIIGEPGLKDTPPKPLGQRKGSQNGRNGGPRW